MVQSLTRPTYGNRFLEPGSRSAQLSQRALGALPGGNTRTTVYSAPYPFYAASGQGCRVTDVEGQSRVDFLNNYTSLIHGHAHPKIVEVSARQMAQGASFGFPTESEIALAELIEARVPSIERIRFCNSGSEAVMMAMQAARAFTGRSRIAKFEGCYHGSYDFAAISVGPSPDRWGEAGAPESVPDSQGVAHSVPGEMLVLPLNDVEACRRLIDGHAGTLAAVIVDPLPNQVGFARLQDDFLPFLREITRRYGTLLISDEIISFRVGYHGSQSAYGFSSDLTTLGKIIGGGFPVGAVGGSAEVMAVFDPTGGRPRVPHGGTFNANPMTMVAGRAAMELMTPAEFDRINGLASRVRAGLGEVFGRRNFPARATGDGSLFRIVYTDRAVTDYRSSRLTPDESARQHELHLRLLGEGYVLGGGALGCISTPIAESEVDGLVAAVDRSIAAMQA